MLYSGGVVRDKISIPVRFHVMIGASATCHRPCQTLNLSSDCVTRQTDIVPDPMELTADVGTVRAITGQVRGQDVVRDTQGKCRPRLEHGKACCGMWGNRAGEDRRGSPEVGEQRAHFCKPMERGLGGQGDTRDPDHGKAQAEVMGLHGC